MKWIIKSCLICTFLCVLFSIKNTQASEHRQPAIADSIYNSGNFLDASIEYERTIFISDNEEDIRNARIKKALCYKQLFKFNDAVKCLERIRLFALPDSIKWNIKVEMALCYYLNNQPNKSLMQIQLAKHLVKENTLKKKTLALETFCYNEMTEWDKAKASGIAYINQTIKDNISKKKYTQKIEYLYLKKQLPKLKKVEKAENLSRFVPGLGQVYCGKIVEGSFNFLLNASFLALGAHQIWNKFYFTGYTAGFGILHKTYIGNMARAKYLAKTVSAERHQDFNSKVLHLLLSIE